MTLFEELRKTGKLKLTDGSNRANISKTGPEVYTCYEQQPRGFKSKDTYTEEEVQGLITVFESNGYYPLRRLAVERPPMKKFNRDYLDSDGNVVYWLEAESSLDGTVGSFHRGADEVFFATTQEEILWFRSLIHWLGYVEKDVKRETVSDLTLAQMHSSMQRMKASTPDEAIVRKMFEYEWRIPYEEALEAMTNDARMEGRG